MLGASASSHRRARSFHAVRTGFVDGGVGASLYGMPGTALIGRSVVSALLSSTVLAACGSA